VSELVSDSRLRGKVFHLKPLSSQPRTYLASTPGGAIRALVRGPLIMFSFARLRKERRFSLCEWPEVQKLAMRLDDVVGEAFSQRDLSAPFLA
jgi:hypothetical protein